MLIPIPREGKELMREYAVGDDVLALYPYSTCFYRGTVAKTPSSVYVFNFSTM
jgi:SGF29 tudor-like domain